jgi:molybdate transport system substrate-binding protein
MRATPRLLCLSGLAVLGLVVASCGDDDNSSSATTAAPTTAAAATTATPTTAAAGATTTAAGKVTGEIQVLAAASLTAAFDEMGTAFAAANPGASAKFSYAGSNDLAAQIKEGAPADVFASADEANMKKVTDAGDNIGEPEIFATNLLEIMVRPGNPKGIKGVADLANPALAVITCDPKVPCGAYAQQVFKAAGVTVTPKSLEENVKAVVTKMTAGEGDAGMVYATDVQAAADKAAGVEIPKDINVVANYPIVTVKQSTNQATAQAFIDFVLSDAGQQILAKYGFTGP